MKPGDLENEAKKLVQEHADTTASLLYKEYKNLAQEWHKIPSLQRDSFTENSPLVKNKTLPKLDISHSSGDLKSASWQDSDGTKMQVEFDPKTAQETAAKITATDGTTVQIKFDPKTGKEIAVDATAKDGTKIHIDPRTEK